MITVTLSPGGVMTQPAEYLAVSLGPTGEIEDVALCGSYSLAVDKAETFARHAPTSAIVKIYECKTIRVYSGKKEEPESP